MGRVFPDIFADIFEARDGGATMAGLEILAAMLAAALIAAGVACWRGHRREAEQAVRLKRAEEQLGELRCREELQEKALAEIIGQAARDRRLRAVN